MRKGSYVPKFEQEKMSMKDGESISFDFDACHCDPYCCEHDDSAFNCPEDCENAVSYDEHCCSNFEKGIDEFSNFLYLIEEELNAFYLYECGFARKESKWHSLVKSREYNDKEKYVKFFVISGFSDDEQNFEDADSEDSLRDVFGLLDNSGVKKSGYSVPLHEFWNDFLYHFSQDELSGDVSFSRVKNTEGYSYVLEYKGDSVYFANPHFLRLYECTLGKDRGIGCYDFADLYHFCDCDLSSFDEFSLRIKKGWSFPFRFQILSKNFEESFLADLVETEISSDAMLDLFVRAFKNTYRSDFKLEEIESDDFFEDRDRDFFPCIVRVFAEFFNKLYSGMIQIKAGDSVKVYRCAYHISSSSPYVIEHKYFRIFFTPYHQGFNDRELSCFSPFLSRLKDDTIFSFDSSASDVCLVDNAISETDDNYY